MVRIKQPMGKSDTNKQSSDVKHSAIETEWILTKEPINFKIIYLSPSHADTFNYHGGIYLKFINKIGN